MRRPALLLLRGLLVGLLAWNLALPAVSLWLARAAERAHPPIARLLDVAGQRVHVRDTGPPPTDPSATGPDERDDPDEAPVLLLLHGASTSLLDFEDSLLPPLAERYRVVAIDRPGHGYSERAPGDPGAGRPDSGWPDPYVQARLAHGVLDALGIERAVWIGHSWAGAVVLAALLEERDSALGGVLIAGVSHPWEGGSAWHAELAALPLVGAAFAWQYAAPAGRLMLDAAVAAAFAPEAVPPGYATRTGVTLSLRPWAYRANATDLTRLSAHLEAQSRRYAAIDRPVLSLSGTADHVVPGRNHDARLAAVLPSVRSVALEGAGHAPHHTRTARVAALITGFVDSLPR